MNAGISSKVRDASKSFITGKALNEPQAVAEQLRHFRNYVELLFSRPSPAS